MRLAIVSDIHGNLPALRAVIERIGALGADRVVNLGDCASGPLWPAETVALLRRISWLHVRGNHDRLVGASTDGRLGRSDGFAWRSLDREARAWLHDLPNSTVVGDALCVHGAPAGDEDYLLEEIVDGRLVRSDEASVAGRVAGVAQKLVFCGHSHLPGRMDLDDGVTIVNPGSVGWQAYRNDKPAYFSETGSPDAWFAMVEFGAGGVSVVHVAVAYDFERAARRAEENRRADWAHALRTGLAPPPVRPQRGTAKRAKARAISA